MKATFTMLRLLCAATLLGLGSGCANSPYGPSIYDAGRSVHYDSFPGAHYRWDYRYDVGRPPAGR